ncbi:MAG TPA: porin family protein [Bacteroidales bacterium]|nr:porin family protein [Bacteroidales bacterium]HQL71387.1 porin family protein [Bacteroidales bacterium]
MKWLLTLLIFLITTQISFSQVTLFAGITYGGAIPDTSVSNSTGSPGIGFNTGLAYTFRLNEKFTLQPELHYHSRNFTYESSLRKDTVVEVEFGGSTTQIPTFYTARVHGNTYTHNLDVSAMATWRIGKYFSLTAGPYGSFAFAGRDAVQVVVTIGEGGVVDDIIQNEEHWADINRFETGLKLGGIFHFNDKFSLRIIGLRAFTRFYQQNYISGDNGQPVSFYHTMLLAGVSYQF